MSYLDSGFGVEETKIPTSGPNKDLEDFLMLEREKAKMTVQMFEFNDICWDKCIPEKLGPKLDGKTETCLTNCVDRFIDVSLYIATRLAKKGDALE